MSAAEGFLTPPRGSADADLERRYGRLLRLYPREFRARRGGEMIGVLMASARDGQTRPAPGDFADIVRGSLLMRLRGPRDSWASALAMFALLAPLFLVLTDVLLVAVPYWESRAAWENRIQSAKAAGAALPPEMLERFHAGGIGLLSERGLLVFAGGHVIVAATVLAGRRRTALAALIVAAVADFGNWAHLTSFHVLPGNLTTLLLTGSVFLLEAFALAVSDPRAARRLVTWRHAVTVLLLAGAVQAWSFAADSSADTPRSPVNAYMVTGLVLAVIAVALPLVLGLGWRLSLLSAVMCYPCALGVAFIYMASSIVPTKVALYLPPLLVGCWSAAWTARRTVTSRGECTAQPADGSRHNGGHGF
jgi:hypothetical protein